MTEGYKHLFNYKYYVVSFGAQQQIKENIKEAQNNFLSFMRKNKLPEPDYLTYHTCLISPVAVYGSYICNNPKEAVQLYNRFVNLRKELAEKAEICCCPKCIEWFFTEIAGSPFMRGFNTEEEAKQYILHIDDIEGYSY